MSSKPKASEYKASEQEKTLAAVSKAEKDYFRETYGPLLREMRDISEQEDLSAYSRGVSQADTMQTLTAKPSLQATRSVDAAADIASAASAQQIQASGTGLAAKRQQQVGVLGTARGQAAEAQSGLGQAARIATTKQLEQAKARQALRQARLDAGVQLGTTFTLQGIKNKAEGGTFFTPKDVGSGGQSRLAYAGQQLQDYLGLGNP